MNERLHRLLNHLCDSLDVGRQADTDRLYRCGVPLIRLAVNEADIGSGKVGDRFPTGVVLFHRARDFETARRVTLGKTS